MSYLPQRAVVDTRTMLRTLGLQLSDLVVPTLLATVAAALGVVWWQRGASLPLTWPPASAAALWLLPGLPVVGLLALRVLAGGRHRSLGNQELSTLAARWSALWAGITVLWLVVTVSGLYGGVAALVGSDNLVAVVARSDDAVARLAALWVALLVALLGRRLTARRDSAALLVLVVVALLLALAETGVVHSHGEGAATAALVVGGLQRVAAIAWAGALLALVHLRPPAFQLRHHLIRLGVLLTAAAAVLGASAVAAGLLLPAGAGRTPVVLGAAQLVGIGLVIAVGQRQRVRVAAAGVGGERLALAGVVAGELVLLAAVVGLGFVLPVG